MYFEGMCMARRRRLPTCCGGHDFDAVVDWIAYTPDDIERDIRLFGGKHPPVRLHQLGERLPEAPAPLCDSPKRRRWTTRSGSTLGTRSPCERRLMDGVPPPRLPGHYRASPRTPTDPRRSRSRSVSGQHPYTVVDRMQRGQEVIVPGDGTSLWVLTWNADLAVGLVGLLGREEAVGEAFHITSDEVLTWNQIYTEVAPRGGRGAQHRPCPFGSDRCL